MTSYLSAVRFIDPVKEQIFAERTVNYVPMDITSREENKEIAWEFLKSSSLQNQIRGLRILIKCHFDRSYERAMLDGYWRSHPQTAEEFGRLIDYQNDSMIPKAALEAVRKQDGAYRPGIFASGSTYWVPC